MHTTILICVGLFISTSFGQHTCQTVSDCPKMMKSSQDARFAVDVPTGYVACDQGMCVADIVGKTCGACGSLPINGRCCGNGQALGDSATCICDTGTKCTKTADCQPNFTCCSDGLCYPTNDNVCDVAGPGHGALV